MFQLLALGLLDFLNVSAFGTPGLSDFMNVSAFGTPGLLDFLGFHECFSFWHLWRSGGRAVCIRKQILEVLQAGNLEDGTQRDTGFGYTAKMVSQGGSFQMGQVDSPGSG